MSSDSTYTSLVTNLTPVIMEQINSGGDALEVAQIIEQIITDSSFPPHITAGEKSKKFIPMKKELSDEDFERRVRDYYGL